LDKLYIRVSTTTKQILYQYIKDTSIILLDYHFRDFFQYCIKGYKIQVMSHHFTNHKIKGLTIIDQDGISFTMKEIIQKLSRILLCVMNWGTLFLTIVVHVLLNL